MENMANKIYFLFLVAVLACVSCSQQEPKPKPASLGKGPVYQEQVQKGPSLVTLDAYRRALHPFLYAIATVESGNKDDAVGDRGRAIGRYQIWEHYWKDAVNYAPAIGGQYSDCTNKEYAERIMIAYFLRYAGEALRTKDHKALARTHNGGPKGARKNATLKYWDKVQEILNS